MLALKAHLLNVPAAAGSADAYLAYPDDGKAYPGVIFYMDAYGLRDYLYEMAQKIAREGYVVLVPNCFYRAGRAPLLSCTFPLTSEARSKVMPQVMKLLENYDFADEGMADASFWLQFLRGQKNVREGKIATTGYCMGGQLSLRTAARIPDDVALALSFHAAHLVTNDDDSVHLLLKKIKAQIYVAHADHDANMNAAQIARFQTSLDESGIHGMAELYEGAAHGFTMADLPAYNPKALERHWQNLIPRLKEVLPS